MLLLFAKKTLLNLKKAQNLSATVEYLHNSARFKVSTADRKNLRSISINNECLLL